MVAFEKDKDQPGKSHQVHFHVPEGMFVGTASRDDKGWLCSRNGLPTETWSAIQVGQVLAMFWKYLVFENWLPRIEGAKRQTSPGLAGFRLFWTCGWKHVLVPRGKRKSLSFLFFFPNPCQNGSGPIGMYSDSLKKHSRINCQVRSGPWLSAWH